VLLKHDGNYILRRYTVYVKGAKIRTPCRPATKFCAVVPNIFSVIIAVVPVGLYMKFVPVHMQQAESRSHHNCGSSVCTLTDVTFLALRIWGWLLGLCNICTRLIYVL
jgi:hypothetical protein